MIISGRPGTWRFTISKEGYYDSIFDYEVTETRTGDLSLERSTPLTPQPINQPLLHRSTPVVAQQQESVTPAAQGSETSVVGTWNVVWDFAPQNIQIQFIIIFNDDGTFNQPKVYHLNPDYAMKATTGRWTQQGNSVSWTSGTTFTGTINMNSMSGNSNAGSWSAERVGTASQESAG